MTRIKINGRYVYVNVLDYSPGTHCIITSRSTEPNDPEVFEYEIYLDEAQEDRCPSYESPRYRQIVLREWLAALEAEQYE